MLQKKIRKLSTLKIKVEGRKKTIKIDIYYI